MEDHIEAVEAAYEFLLAYAAQGREDDVDGPGQKSREVLQSLDTALDRWSRLRSTQTRNGEMPLCRPNSKEAFQSGGTLSSC